MQHNVRGMGPIKTRIWQSNAAQRLRYGTDNFLNLFCNVTTKNLLKFKVCKSVRHHTIQINHLLDAKISPVYYLMFIYSSACFRRPHAHHQELNNCSSSLWFFPSERGDSSAVCRGWAGWPDRDQKYCHHHAPKVKPVAATAAVELLMMGVRTPEACWTVNKLQVINWRNCCI